MAKKSIGKQKLKKSISLSEAMYLSLRTLANIKKLIDRRARVFGTNPNDMVIRSMCDDTLTELLTNTTVITAVVK